MGIFFKNSFSLPSRLSLIYPLALICYNQLSIKFKSQGMTPDFQVKLKEVITKHEGYDNFPYPDTKGNITIGYGYNLSARGLPHFILNNLYEQDVNYFYFQLSKDYPWFNKLNDARKIALISMCFMGYKKFKTFKKMISAFELEDYISAEKEILDSLYAKEVGNRAVEIGKIIRTGVL
jgi:lysozyme